MGNMYLKSKKTRKLHYKALRMSRFPCILPSPNVTSPITKNNKELCRSVTLSTGMNYVKFHDNTIRHLSVQGINIIVLKKAGLLDKLCPIHNFFRKTKQRKFIKKICKSKNKEKFFKEYFFFFFFF